MKVTTNIPELWFETGKDYTIYFPIMVLRFYDKIKIENADFSLHSTKTLFLVINTKGEITNHEIKKMAYYPYPFKQNTKSDEFQLCLTSAQYGEVREIQNPTSGLVETKIINWKNKEMPMIIPNFVADDVW